MLKELFNKVNDIGKNARNETIHSIQTAFLAGEIRHNMILIKSEYQQIVGC